MNLKRIILSAAIAVQLAAGALAQTQIALPKVSDRQRFVDTVDDLASIAGLRDGDLVTVKELGATYVYDSGSSATVANYSVIDGPSSSGRFLRHAGFLVAEYGGAPQWRSESSTFSGWGTSIGSDHAPFNQIRLRVRSWDASVTNIAVRVKAGGPKGPTLASVTTALAEDANDYQTFTLNQTVDADCLLWVEYSSDGHMGYYAGAADRWAEGNAQTRYTTAGSTSAVPTTTGSTNAPLWYELRNSDPAYPPMTSYDKRRIRLASGRALPRLDLRSNYIGVAGRNLEIFRRGIVDSADPYRFDWDWYGDIVGEQFRRRFIMPAPSAGNYEGVVTLRDDEGRYVAASTALANIVAAGSSPVSNINVLAVGDSLTANGTYVTELERMITGTGGTPAGLTLSNVTFVGSQGTPPASHEGQSGQSLQWFAQNESSPFVYSGVLDIDQYATDNSISSIDCVVILLTWNAWTNITYTEPDQFSTYEGYMQELIDAFQAHNASIKIVLVGLPLPNPDGQADDYGYSGSGSATGYASANGLRRLAFGYNLMLQNLANDYRTSHTATAGLDVFYVDSAARFDLEYNAVTQTVAVNERNAATETIGANGVHPDTEGYYQIADVVLGAINAALLQ